jgi:hypothetical protein
MTCHCDDCQASRGRRKEFRQSAGLPEDEVPRKLHPKGKNKRAKLRPKKKKHKHIWVRVSYGEYTRYVNHRNNYWGAWWDSYYNDLGHPFLEWRHYYVCCDCLQGKVEHDLAASRAWDRKNRRRRRA